MRALEVTEFGGPDVLTVADRPWPVAVGGEVVVAIAATSVNPTDLAARSGGHRVRMPSLELPFTPGWDVAGMIADAGNGRSGFAVGDRVVGLTPWVTIGGVVGSCAEAAAVDPDWLAPLPDEIDFVTAATLPLNTLTARQGLDLLALPQGASLFVTGASGAVGGFAVQLAVRDGLRVIAQASTGDEDWVSSLGADEVVPRSGELTELGPFDGLFDAVPIGAAATTVLQDGGAALFTRGIDDLPQDRDLRYEFMLARSDGGQLRELVELAHQGQLKTRVARTYDLADAAEAHKLAEVGHPRGKLVLTT